jgi:hypothetical protein
MPAAQQRGEEAAANSPSYFVAADGCAKPSQSDRSGGGEQSTSDLHEDGESEFRNTLVARVCFAGEANQRIS